MSAHMVSDKQIDVLVSYMIKEKIGYYINGWVYASRENAESIGQILIDENYRSVNARYAERTEGYFGKPDTYKFNSKCGPLPDAVTILKLANNSAYQSDNADKWEESLAYKILQAIKEYAIRKVPGYEEAPWGID